MGSRRATSAADTFGVLIVGFREGQHAGAPPAQPGRPAPCSRPAFTDHMGPKPEPPGVITASCESSSGDVARVSVGVLYLLPGAAASRFSSNVVGIPKF